MSSSAFHYASLKVHRYHRIFSVQLERIYIFEETRFVGPLIRREINILHAKLDMITYTS
jgi:hypothetical protein